MDEFLAYGQAAPLAVRYDQRPDPLKEIRGQQLKQEIGHIDRMNQIDSQKKKAQAEFGQFVSQNEQAMQNVSFIQKNGNVYKEIENEFANNFNKIADHYNTPRTDRDVNWHRELSNMKNGFISNKIRNDKKNQELHQRVNNLLDSGKIEKENYEQWLSEFLEVARNGESFEDYAMNENIRVMPLSSKENYLSESITALNNFGFKAHELESVGYDRFVPAEAGINRFINEGASDVLYSSSLKSFDKLTEAKKKEIFSGYDRSDPSTHNAAVEAYMRRTLKNVNINQNFTSSINNARENQSRDYFMHNIYQPSIEPIVNALKPYVKKDSDGNLIKPWDPDARPIAKKHQTYGINHLLTATPDHENTVITLNLSDINGQPLLFEIPIEKGMNLDWGDNPTNQPYNTITGLSPDFDPTNDFEEFNDAANIPLQMTIEDVNLEMNDKQLMVILKNMAGNNYSRYANPGFQEDSSTLRSENIRIEDRKIGEETKKYLVVGERIFPIEDNIQTFYKGSDDVDLYEKGEIKDRIRKVNVKSRVKTGSDPRNAYRQYNWQYEDEYSSHTAKRTF